MSLRLDSVEWISGALLIGETGLGVLGSAIPSGGTNGASYLYNDLTLPADAGKEIAGRIITAPAGGTLFAYEDGSFTFTGPDGSYSFTYQLYVDGVATGPVTTASLEVGVTLPTLVQPSSTTSAGAWTATGAATLHAAINELVPSASEYISVNSASTTELVLAESAHPGAASQVLAYRASSTQGSTLTVTLKQGVTTIMTRTHALTGVDTLYTQTLTAPEIALITAGAISVTLTTS